MIDTFFIFFSKLVKIEFDLESKLLIKFVDINLKIGDLVDDFKICMIRVGE